MNQNELNEQLYWAVCEHNIPKMVQLLNDGANINAPSIADWEPLTHAAELGHLDMVKVLVERGANVNLVDADGLRPIDWAQQRGYQDIVKYLIENGAQR